jgi:hypothetical protein
MLLFRSLTKNMAARHAQLKPPYGPYGFFAESETPLCNHSSPCDAAMQPPFEGHNLYTQTSCPMLVVLCGVANLLY